MTIAIGSSAALRVPLVANPASAGPAAAGDSASAGAAGDAFAGLLAGFAAGGNGESHSHEGAAGAESGSQTGVPLLDQAEQRTADAPDASAVAMAALSFLMQTAALLPPLTPAPGGLGSSSAVAAGNPAAAVDADGDATPNAPDSAVAPQVYSATAVPAESSPAGAPLDLAAVAPGAVGPAATKQPQLDFTSPADGQPTAAAAAAASLTPAPASPVPSQATANPASTHVTDAPAGELGAGLGTGQTSPAAADDLDRAAGLHQSLGPAPAEAVQPAAPAPVVPATPAGAEPPATVAPAAAPAEEQLDATLTTTASAVVVAAAAFNGEVLDQQPDGVRPAVRRPKEDGPEGGSDDGPSVSPATAGAPGSSPGMTSGSATGVVRSVGNAETIVSATEGARLAAAGLPDRPPRHDAGPADATNPLATPQSSMPVATSAADLPAIAPATIEAVTPKTLERVAQTIIERVGKGGGDAQIRLDPPELGSVTIRIHTAGAQVRVDVHAERPEVATMLREHTETLTQLLENRGLGLAHVNIGFSAGGFGQGGAQQQPAQQGRPAAAGFSQILGIENPPASAASKRLRAAYNPDGRHIYRI